MKKLRALAAHKAVRITRTIVRRVVAICAVILAAAIVTFATIDLGPLAKSRAEEEGYKFLGRPLHIGKLSFHLWTGRFLVEDLVIEGRKPESKPFLVAKRVEVALPWSTLFDKRIVLDSIEMTDWRVHLEVQADGKHNLPNLTPKGSSDKKRVWTTTLQWVRAHRGAFTYEDHGAPWRIAAENVEVIVAKPGGEYRGQARFTNGTIGIQEYVPFGARMSSTFKLDGSRIVFDGIKLDTDGAKSMVVGDVNLKFFPEMMFRVDSTIDADRMRRIFFAHESFTLAGTTRFSGNFHVFKQRRPDGTSGTSRELTGTFESPLASVNNERLENLRGSIRWTPRRLAVTNATTSLHGGTAHFDYEMAPLGVRGVKPTARLDVKLADISLFQLSERFALEGMRLSGALSGAAKLEWTLGRFGSDRRLAGSIHVTPPRGATLMTETLPVELIEQGRLPIGPPAPLAPLIPIPVGGDVTFDITPTAVHIEPSTVATQRTFVRIEGDTTTSGTDSRMPFKVSSADWRESYRTFATLMTALGARTTAIDVDGYGTVQGVLLGNVKRPRIEGTFAAERMRVWDVEWGSVRGRTVIDNGYADLSETTITKGPSTMKTDGRFALGARKDGGDEINATVRVKDWPLADLKHPFGLDRTPLDGRFSGDFHVVGDYRAPHGYGVLTIAQGSAWGEPFDSASATVRLEGRGAQLSGIELLKSGGRAGGAAHVDWDEGTYSFDVASTLPFPVESVVALRGRTPEELPLSGLIDFSANGSGTFDSPRYTVSGAIRDLFVGDEGIGRVNVRGLAVNGDTMMVNAEVVSARLDVGVVGRIDLANGPYADLRFTVSDTSLDPYLRAFDPRLSPYTTAVVSGSVNVKGNLSDGPQGLEILAHVSKLDMRLFDYKLTSAGEFDIEFDKRVVRIPEKKPLGLYGDDTKLVIDGEIGLDDESLAMTVRGAANLAVLQGFVPGGNIRSSGTATLSATLSGALREPVARGTLQIQNGRFRHFGVPLALEHISGPITFTDEGVTLDGLTAELGKGRVQFEGNIEKEGYLPGQINVTMFSVGAQGVRVSYPEGMRSEVEVTRLTLRGTFDDMHLDGEVRVKDALYSKPFPSSVISLMTNKPAVPPPSTGELSLPLTFDGILIRSESSIKVQNSGEFSARMSSSANLELRGTFDQPVLSGDMELDRGGEITLFAKRYNVTQGTIYFNNPSKIEPSFDIEAETRVRVPGETYRITATMRGTCCSRLEQPTFTADPPLSNIEIVRLLVNDVPPAQDTELRQALGDSRSQDQLFAELATRQVTSYLYSSMNQTLARTLGVGFSLSPTLFDPNLQSSRAEPGARVILTRRAARNLFLTYSRNLSSASEDELIVVEYEASDRVTWILSRNEDQTYAVEVRMRRTF
jgi:hypothetical protein